MTIWSKAFWLGAAERGLKTFAQSLVSALVVGVGVLDVDWTGAVSIAAVATAASLLTSIANSDFTAGVVEPANTHRADT